MELCWEKRVTGDKRVHSLDILSVNSLLCFLVEDMIPQFPAPVTCCHTSSADTYRLLLEPQPKINAFFYKSMLVMVFYHSKRNVTHTSSFPTGGRPPPTWVSSLTYRTSLPSVEQDLHLTGKELVAPIPVVPLLHT